MTVVELLEGQQRLDARVGRLETKVAALETKVDGLETKVDGLDANVRAIMDHLGVPQVALPEPARRGERQGG